MSSIYKRESAIIDRLIALRCMFADCNNQEAAKAIDLAVHEIESIKGYVRIDVASQEYIPSATLGDAVPPESWFKEKFADSIGKFALENGMMTFETIKESSFGIPGSIMKMRTTFLTDHKSECVSD